MRLVSRHLVEQFVDSRIDDHDPGVRGADEADVDHPAIEGDQIVIEARGVEQPDGLGMIAELRPADRFPQFIHRPDAAGDGQKAVRQVGEHLLAFVHPRNDVQFGAAAMRDFGPDERIGDHPDHLAARFQGAVGDRTHQPEPAAAIDDPDAAARQRPADVARGFHIDRVFGGCGPAIDGNALHHSSNINWPTSIRRSPSRCRRRPEYRRPDASRRRRSKGSKSYRRDYARETTRSAIARVRG